MGLGTAIPLGYIANSLNIRIRDLQETLSHAPDAPAGPLPAAGLRPRCSCHVR